jgi:hypothetical protein
MSAPLDFDGPWKAALEELLEPCFGLLFRAAHRAIDWSLPPRFLDTELEASRNPFATVVLAHPLAQDTRGNPPARAHVKLMLTRRLYRLGYTRTQILQLYHFIDWLLQLPPDLEAQSLQQIKAFEDEAQMNYISYAERVGQEEGRLEG